MFPMYYLVFMICFFKNFHDSNVKWILYFIYYFKIKQV